MAQTPKQMLETRSAFAKARAEGRVCQYSGYEAIYCINKDQFLTESGEYIPPKKAAKRV